MGIGLDWLPATGYPLTLTDSLTRSPPHSRCAFVRSFDSSQHANADLESKVAKLEADVRTADSNYHNAAAERAAAKAERAEAVAELESQLEQARAAASSGDGGGKGNDAANDAANDELNAKIDELNARVADLEKELTDIQLAETLLREQKEEADNKVEQLKGLNSTLMAKLKGGSGLSPTP